MRCSIGSATTQVPAQTRAGTHGCQVNVVYSNACFHFSYPFLLPSTHFSDMQRDTFDE